RIYVDENFPSSAVNLLRSMKARVTTAQQAGMTGRSDEDHAAFALKHGCVLLTCDRDFLNERRFPLVHCPAIVVCNLGAGSMRDIRKVFRCLKTMFRVPQFYDKWIKIDASREMWVEHARYLNGTSSRTRYRVQRG